MAHQPFPPVMTVTSTAIPFNANIDLTLSENSITVNSNPTEFRRRPRKEHKKNKH
jgi:hypothetical protein